jgi:hypothetical protein
LHLLEFRDDLERHPSLWRFLLLLQRSYMTKPQLYYTHPGYLGNFCELTGTWARSCRN